MDRRDEGRTRHDGGIRGDSPKLPSDDEVAMAGSTDFGNSTGNGTGSVKSIVSVICGAPRWRTQVSVLGEPIASDRVVDLRDGVEQARGLRIAKLRKSL